MRRIILYVCALVCVTVILGKASRTQEAARGQEVVRTEDRNGDGRPDKWWYEVDGKVARTEDDWDFNGIINRRDYYGKHWNTVRAELDLDQDGKMDTWETVDYVGLKQARIEHRKAPKGPPYQIEIRDYQRTPTLRIRLWDRDGDGSYENVSYYNGAYLYLAMTDSNHDGRTDLWTRYDYHADGRPTQRVVAQDTDGDGMADIWRYYDPRSGEMFDTKKDADGDGEPD